MTRRATLPLGVDVGATRTRVALIESAEPDAPHLIAVAVRPTGGDPATAIADAVRELATRERRCVLALAPPAASLRIAQYPRMGRRERERAARFDAAHGLLSSEPAAVRVVSLREAGYAVGVAPRAALEGCLREARRARLRPIAVDHAAFALRRAFASDDAIVDVGHDGALLVIPGAAIPATRSFPTGGRSITQAIALALGTDDATAEARKRSVGTGGAGDHVRAALVDQLAAALLEARATGREIRSVALAGNGARLIGFADALERAGALPVRLGALPATVSRTLPPDVIRAASPDWGLAYGLALWGGPE